MDIALDYYRIFEAVARHRSFTRAAEALVFFRHIPHLTLVIPRRPCYSDKQGRCALFFAYGLTKSEALFTRR